MSQHNCRGAIAASARDYWCRKHNVAFVPKIAVQFPEDHEAGAEGTVKVCPVCVAQARARVTALRAMVPASTRG